MRDESAARRSRSARAARTISRAAAWPPRRTSAACFWAPSRSSAAVRSAETSVCRSRRLELAVADDVVLELLDAVGEVVPLAPDLLEAVGDLEQELFRRRAAVAAERGALQRTWRISTGVIASSPEAFRGAR